MKIDPGTGDRYLIMHETTQPGGNRRRLRIPHIGVTDEGSLAGKLRRIRLEKRNEARRARFFFPLDKECRANGQRSARHDPGACRFKEGHELALVVGCTAAIEPLDVVFALPADRLEWRAC